MKKQPSKDRKKLQENLGADFSAIEPVLRRLYSRIVEVGSGELVGPFDPLGPLSWTNAHHAVMDLSYFAWLDATPPVVLDAATQGALRNRLAIERIKLVAAFNGDRLAIDEFEKASRIAADCLSKVVILGAQGLPQPKPTKTGKHVGRRPAQEKDSATEVIAALTAHHGYDTGSISNYQPATNRSLKEQFGLSNNALTRFLKDHGGTKAYKVACQNESLPLLLANWNREDMTFLAEFKDDIAKAIRDNRKSQR